MFEQITLDIPAVFAVFFAGCFVAFLFGLWERVQYRKVHLSQMDLAAKLDKVLANQRLLLNAQRATVDGVIDARDKMNQTLSMRAMPPLDEPPAVLSARDPVLVSEDQ